MRPTVDAIERDLRTLLDGDVEFDAHTRELYSTDAGLYQIRPLGVVSPRSAQDVVALAEFAAEHGIPLVPRGSGSGLAGAAVGAGIQVDFTRYMNKILEVADDGSWARVQPGVVMGVLNKRAKRYGTFFAPNPSSENYCSLGGMMANNSSGSRSVQYGMTIDHVRSLEVVLAGGEVVRAGTVHRNGAPLDSLVPSGGTAGRAFGELLALLDEKQQTIRSAQPHVVKNASGFRFETILDDDAAHLHRTFIGSEGALGLITEATLNLVPLPGKRAIAMAYFPEVRPASQAVFPILDLGPTSLEIMDANFLSFVRGQLPHIDAMLPEEAGTALLIEFEAADTEELDEKLRTVEDLLADGPALEVKRAIDPAEQAGLWQVRRSAVPLLQKLPGPKRIAEVIEDVTIHPSVLADYMERLDGILGRMDISGIMYGHAGDGNIHTRPLMNLKDAHDLARMQRLLDEVFELVLELKGTPSGEHGDGLIRSPLVRRVYGDEVYGIFARAKDLFDPQGIMNPGKKIVQEGQETGVARNMRYGADYWTYSQSTLLNWPGGAFQAEIEKCHGCAQCKSLVATTMCPTYKVTTREHASPRAKANLLRNVLNGNLDPEDTYVQEATKDIIDYCIECGMCAVECPSNVDIPKLMLEAKAKYRQGAKTSRTDLVLGNATGLSRWGHATAPVADRLRNRGILRRAAEPLTGIDRRRTLPPFAAKSFEDILADRQKGDTRPPVEVGPGDAVATAAFFYDQYANYHDPSLGQDMDKLLRAHAVQVHYPEQRSSGIPEMLYGRYEKARDIARHNVESADPFVVQGDVLVSGEPTASFAFRKHYEDYLGGEETGCEPCGRVAAATRDLGEFLVELRSGHPGRVPQPTAMDFSVGYHLPCHLKAQSPAATFLNLLREVPGLEVIDLNAGCCGMAGTFGLKSGTYELSMATGAPLFDRIAESDPDVLVTECSTCRMQLEEATGRDVEHPAQLLCRAYGL